MDLLTSVSKFTEGVKQFLHKLWVSTVILCRLLMYFDLQIDLEKLFILPEIGCFAIFLLVHIFFCFCLVFKTLEFGHNFVFLSA